MLVTITRQQSANSLFVKSVSN